MNANTRKLLLYYIILFLNNRTYFDYLMISLLQMNDNDICIERYWGRQLKFILRFRVLVEIK